MSETKTTKRPETLKAIDINAVLTDALAAAGLAGARIVRSPGTHDDVYLVSVPKPTA